MEPDLVGKTVSGRVAIDLVSTADSLETVDLDIGALTIDSVGADGHALAFAQGDRRLQARLEKPSARGQRRRLAIVYHGAPRFGLQFVEEKSQMYTIRGAAAVAGSRSAVLEEPRATP